MVVERKITKKYYFMAFIMTTLIFSVSFLLGWQINNITYADSFDQLSDIKTGLLRYDLQYKMLGEYPCKFIQTGLLVNNEFEETRLKINRLEKELGNQDSRVLHLKEYYSLLQLSDWIYYRDINEQCSNKYDIILYFYSNDIDSCPSCEQQGFVLDYVYATNEDIRVYSFDYDLDLIELDMLKEMYSINSIPSVVVNGNRMIGSFSEKEDIQSLL
ncbi:thioredoxin family protein [archaeon]|jgi:5-bromo-4-chloroindolyl phosphate hydrolysis protein|nr:thioredoxin family protein [archaeon]